MVSSINSNINLGQNHVLKTKITINGLPLHALIDTGASINCISSQIVSALKAKGQLIEIRNKSTQIKVANGRTINSEGEVTLPILLEGETIEVTLQVITNLSNQIVLGCAFLKQHEAVISFNKNQSTLTLPHFQEHVNAQERTILLEEDLEIPPYSQCLAKCKTNITMPEGVLFCTNTTESLFTHRGVLVSKALINSRNTDQLLVANITNESVFLNRSEVLATLEHVDSQDQVIGDICNIEDLEEENDEEINDQFTIMSREESIALIRTSIPELTVNYEPFDELEVRKIARVIFKFKSLFDTKTKNYGAAKGVEHKIITGEAKPTNQPPHRVSPTERNIIIQMTREMLNSKVIQPSSSPWASPVVLVRKKDGKQRFCIDFRKLNTLTQRDVYPIPRIEDCLTALGGNRFFSSFDLFSGFWQISMASEDKQKTAFIVDGGLFEFNVMPFGLTNATATFQRYMDMVLAGLKWTSLLVYLDDIFENLNGTFTETRRNLH